MPTEQSTPPATATTRRSFLTRTAGFGAMATVATLASPGHALVDGAHAAGSAGSARAVPAQSSSDLSDADFAAFTTPLELAAVLAYQAALDSSVVGRSASSMVQKYQDHHQTVADTLTTLLAADADPPLPAMAFSDPIASSIKFAGAEPDILRALAAMENTLSATHLLALETLAEPVTAKVVAQVLATEAQQATALANAAGDDLAAITPPIATTADGLQPGDVAGAPPKTAGSDSASGSDGSSGTRSGGGNQGGTSTGGNDSGGSGSGSNSGGGSTDSGSGSGGSGSGSGGGASGGDSGSGGGGSGSGDSGSSSGGPTGGGSTSGT